MRFFEFSANHLSARATSGQRLDIRYDPATNAIIFMEDDWAVGCARGIEPVRSVFREQLETAKVRLAAPPRGLRP